MFLKLIEKGIIKLLESKCSKEIRRTNDPILQVSQDHQLSYRNEQYIQKTSPTTGKVRKNHAR